MTETLTLPGTGDNSTSIIWASSDTNVITNNGTVTRPTSAENDAVVTLTATITSGDKSDTKEFTVTVKRAEVVTPTFQTNLDTTEANAAKGAEPTLTVAVQTEGIPSHEGTLTYQWYRSTDNQVSDNDTPVGTNSPSYQPTVADTELGTKFYYYVKVTNAVTAKPERTATATSATKAVTITKKAGVALTDKTVATTEITKNSVTLTAIELEGSTIEYAVSTTESAPTTGWQTSTKFENLAFNTSYYFFARTKATADTAAGDAISAQIKTLMDVTITGDAKVGATLTADTNGGSYNYQWKVSDTEDGDYTSIDGATDGTYTIAADYVGKYIKVSVLDKENSTEVALSAAKKVEKGDVTVTPATISAAQEVGATLSNDLLSSFTSGGVGGTFAWVTTNNANKVTTTKEYSYTFTPSNTDAYNVYEGTVAITAKYAKPTSTPTLEKGTAYGTTKFASGDYTSLQYVKIASGGNIESVKEQDWANVTTADIKVTTGDKFYFRTAAGNDVLASDATDTEVTVISDNINTIQEKLAAPTLSDVTLVLDYKNSTTGLLVYKITEPKDTANVEKYEITLTSGTKTHKVTISQEDANKRPFVSIQAFDKDFTVAAGNEVTAKVQAIAKAGSAISNSEEVSATGNVSVKERLATPVIVPSDEKAATLTVDGNGAPTLKLALTTEVENAGSFDVTIMDESYNVVATKNVTGLTTSTLTEVTGFEFKDSVQSLTSNGKYYIVVMAHPASENNYYSSNESTPVIVQATAAQGGQE